MTCYCQEELASYLQSASTGEMQQKIERHVDECARCQRVLEELTQDDVVRDYFTATFRDTTTFGRQDEDVGSSPQATSAETSTWAPSRPRLPAYFSRFLLKSELGEGGFGVVYRAEDPYLDREVAVKIPHRAGLSVEGHQRFVREGSAAALLHHPHIVQVHQFGMHEGVGFLVSEYCSGQTLRELLDDPDTELSVFQIVHLVLSLADAVSHAHQNGVVHRDIKPSNVILDGRAASGELPFCPKLTDFGTAKLLDTSVSLTASHSLIGTAPYMAPEQISGSDEARPSCDIYALGVVLYELLAGRVPLRGEDVTATIHRVMAEEPVPLHQVRSDISRDLSAICSCCLEKDPRNRYRSAQELAQDLRRLLQNEPTQARPLRFPARAMRWTQRNPLAVTVMGTVILLFASLGVGFAWHGMRLRTWNDRLQIFHRQALQMKERAEESELQARRLAYVSDVRLAERLLREDDLKSAWRILERYDELPAKEDIRGAEWHFLRRAIRPDAKCLAETNAALYFVRFSPDDSLFATAGQDGLVRVFDWSSKTLQQVIACGQGEINSVAFSPDGSLLATAGDDGTIATWQVESGKRVSNWDAHEGMVFGIEFLPDGQGLLSCGSDGMVHLWKDGRLARSLRDHEDRVEAIAVSSDGRWSASVGKDRTLVVRRLDSGELYFRWDEARGSLSSVLFSPDGNRLAVGQVAGELKSLFLFDLQEKSLLLSREHSDGIRAVSFSQTGDRVLTLDSPGTARVWAISGDAIADDSAKPLMRWRAHEGRAYSGTFLPDGQGVLTVGDDGRVKQFESLTSLAGWTLSIQELHKSIRPSIPFNLQQLDFLHDTGDLAIAAGPGIVLLRPGRKESLDFQNPGGHLLWKNVAAIPQRRGFFRAGATPLGSKSGSTQPIAIIRRCDSSGKIEQTILEVPDAWILDMASSPTGELLAVTLDRKRGGGGKELWLIDGRTGQLVHNLPAASGTRVGFTAKGKSMYFGKKRDIHFFDLVSGETRTRQDAHSTSQTALAVSQNGRWIATADENREIQIRRLPSLDLHAVLQGHTGMITALEFSTCGETLFSSSYDGTVKAWNIETGQTLTNIHQGPEGVSHMAIASDGSCLAIVEDRRQVRVYRLVAP